MGLVGCYDWRAGVSNTASLQHQCPARNVRVVNDNGDGYARVVELDVCGERRVYQDLGGARGYAWVDQTPRAAEGPERAPSAPRATRSPAQPLRRTERSDEAGTFALLSTRLHVSDYDFTFFAAPARERERLWLHVRGLAPVVPPGCELGLFVDGALVSLDPEFYQVVGSSGEYRILVSLETLRQMASASRVAGRVCNREWRLSAEDQTAIREFISRIDEELAWLQRDALTSGGGATP